MLEVKSLSKNFGGVKAVWELDLAVNAGDIFGVIGPNGSGKSTLAHVLAGKPTYSVTSGEALLDGENLLDMLPEFRARSGLFLSF